jgi:hypothetical protein
MAGGEYSVLIVKSFSFLSSYTGGSIPFYLLLVLSAPLNQYATFVYAAYIQNRVQAMALTDAQKEKVVSGIEVFASLQSTYEVLILSYEVSKYIYIYIYIYI